MKYIECSNEWLRDVIKGKVEFRKCPLCDKEGVELQYHNENGDPCNSEDNTAYRTECENCNGLAFIENAQ